MKNGLIFLFGLFFFSFLANGQARLEGDTLYYNGQKYWRGKTITTAYGSDNKKDFVFVSVVADLSPIPAPSSWSKTEMIIDKIYKRSNKYYLRAKGPRKNTFHIDVEGAVDNKEIKVE